MPYAHTMQITGLRSPHDKVNGLVYFGRMVDKIRLHAKGELPADYQANLGEGFDKACVNFLGIAYSALAEQAKAGGTDEELLEWCMANGKRRDEFDIAVWGEYLRKRGWNDVASERLAERKAEYHCTDRADIQTFFDFIDFDEGRK